MKKMLLDGVLIDKCETCKGVWLDANELEMLKYDDGKDKEGLVLELKSELMAEKRRLMTTVGLCPKCQEQPLVAFRRSGVELDQCPSCFGLFFDHGELQKVLEKEQSGVKKFLYGLKKNLKIRKTD
jgi:Zn-finger nucleic acid-binding protein